MSPSVFDLFERAVGRLHSIDSTLSVSIQFDPDAFLLMVGDDLIRVYSRLEYTLPDVYQLALSAVESLVSVLESVLESPGWWVELDALRWALNGFAGRVLALYTLTGSGRAVYTTWTKDEDHTSWIPFRECPSRHVRQECVRAAAIDACIRQIRGIRAV